MTTFTNRSLRLFIFYSCDETATGSRPGLCLQLGPPIIETAFCNASVLAILLYAKPTLLPVLMDLTELFDCHVWYTR